MKKLQIISVLIITIIAFSSCKENVKKEAKQTEKRYLIDEAQTTINWVAYKTTKKVPVKGQFNNVTIENTQEGSTILKALNGLKFTIPVNSLFTKDTIRDRKLKKIFFGTMKNTNSISGIITMDNESSGSVELTMNGISHALPITSVIKDNVVTIEALMVLDNWQAQLAIEALNIACKDLHSGDDGIPKTWNEVSIKVETHLKYE